MEANKLLLYLSYEHEGDWEKIFDVIKEKKEIKGEMISRAKEATKNANYITLVDNDYAINDFRKIMYPPFVLYYKGNIDLLRDSEAKRVSVIGTRHSTKYGEEMTKTLVEGLADDIQIVSGLAKGIDSVAHISALNSNKKTIAVLPCGIDYVYPKENKELIDQILESGGLILSEYFGDLPPTKERCRFRNRLVAALSKGILVTEAYKRSGTSITVNYGLQLGREIMCVPQDANKDSSCNDLIKEGAYLVQSSKDIEEILNF